MRWHSFDVVPPQYINPCLELTAEWKLTFSGRSFIGQVRNFLDPSWCIFNCNRWVKCSMVVWKDRFRYGKQMAKRNVTFLYQWSLFSKHWWPDNNDSRRCIEWKGNSKTYQDMEESMNEIKWIIITNIFSLFHLNLGFDRKDFKVNKWQGPYILSKCRQFPWT